MELKKDIIKAGFVALCNRLGEDVHEASALIKRFTGAEGKKLDRDYQRFRKIMDAIAQDLDL